MASAQHPNRVYFTSLDRSPVDPNTDFTITFDTPIENSKNFEVVSAAFPNTFHQFAGYETILYFYHELFQGGSVAIGVPMSITPFLQEGKTGEAVLPSARPAGREQYLDKRYFLDGDDLTTYLNDWIQSLSATGGTNFPAASTGLCPFYFANDDPSQPATFFANEAATSVNFSTLSFKYDNTTALGGTGSLKLVFEDSGGHDVRVASIVDFGYLKSDNYYPSLLSYKLGYTDLQYEAFGSVVPVNSSNNQLSLSVDIAGTSFVVNNSNNQFNYQASGGIDIQYNIATGTYNTLAELVVALNAASVSVIGGPAIAWTVAGSVVNVLITPPAAVTYVSLFCVPGLQSLIGFPANFTSSVSPYTLTGTAVGPNGVGTYTDTFTLTVNDYTSDGLAAELQTVFRGQYPTAPTSLVTKNITVSATAGVLTIAFNNSTAFPVRLVFNSSDPVQQACKTLLGFVADSTSSTATSSITAPNSVVFQSSISPAAHLAPDPINLIRTSNIYFASSLSAGEALSSAGRKDILFCVPLTAPIGSVQLYQSTLSGVIVNRPPSVVRNLRVSLLDDNFQIMEAMPQNSSISVEIHFSYDDEANTNNVSTNPYAQKV
jgi:hypothetical protein